MSTSQHLPQVFSPSGQREATGACTLSRTHSGTTYRIRTGTPAPIIDFGFRLLIADDHPVVRGGLHRSRPTEGFEVVGDATDGEAAIREVQLLRPDVVLMDVRMPGVDGIEGPADPDTVPETAVLVLTMFDDDTTVFTAMQARARGYLLKGAEQDEIAVAVRRRRRRPGRLRSRRRLPRLDFFAGAPRHLSGCHFRSPPSASARSWPCCRGQDDVGSRKQLFLVSQDREQQPDSNFAKLKIADRAAAVLARGWLSS